MATSPPTRPLTKPTAAAPPTPAANPTTTAGKSGRPELNEPRIASAERTEARLITQPTDRSIDTGGDDDEGLAEAEQQHRYDGDQNVLGIADGEEIDRAAGRQRHRDDEEQDHEAEKHPGPDAAQEDRRALRGGEDARSGAVAAPRGPDGAFGHDFGSLKLGRRGAVEAPECIARPFIRFPDDPLGGPILPSPLAGEGPGEGFAPSGALWQRA